MWAYNPGTHKMELQPILHVWINHDNDLVDLTITKTLSGQHGKATKSSSEVLHTNQKHPFLTVEKGFLPVGQITLGMHVVEASGLIGVVSGWKIVPGMMTMYNLTIAQDHTFVIGVGQWIVHNICVINNANKSIKQEVQPTLDRIERGDSFPHRNDGTTFQNRNGDLPLQPNGYYKEYVHPTPGVAGPGPRRVIVGAGGDIYYSPFHYGLVFYQIR